MIVLRPPSLVAQYFVGRANFLEGCLVAALVGMVLEGELAILALDFGGGGVARDGEEGVGTLWIC